ncbi:MAG: hypothetical protein LC721_10670 [Actinobacteria bacterium]|nr:hypothetical protein [Actinomycetota bacterium]
MRLFWPDARPFRVWMGLGVVLVVTAPLLDTATIWLFKLLIDDVLVVRKLAAFGPIALAYVAITVVTAAVEFADGYLAAWIGENFDQGHVPGSPPAQRLDQHGGRGEPG